jgi:hypothetical protein
MVIVMWPTSKEETVTEGRGYPRDEEIVINLPESCEKVS